MKVDASFNEASKNDMKVDASFNEASKNGMKVDAFLMPQKIISYSCINCNKKFKKKSYLDIHLKKHCKMNINFNNIYKFNKLSFGKNKYGNNGGDIYIIQTDHNFDNIFKIGKTTNIYNRLTDFRCGAVIEPRLYFYYPFKNIKKADNDIKCLLSKFRIKREIFKCDIEELRKIILKYQKKVDNCKIENEPLIKETDLSECEFCDKLFYTKNEMFKHLKKCEDYRSSFTNNGEHNCDFCNRSFNHKNSYYRHMKHYCKKKKEVEINTNKEDLQNKIKELEEQVDQLKKSQNVTYNYNNNNITLIAHNKSPDLSHLTDKDYLKIMNRGFNSVPKLIEAIHFNPEKPENQNVYIPNIKNKYAMTWDGGKWNLSNRENVIDDLYDDNSNILIDKLEELDPNSRVVRKFKRFMEQKADDSIMSKVKDDIKLLLFNSKNVIKIK